MMNAIHHDEMPSLYFMQYEIVPPHPGLLPREGEGVCRTVEGEWSVRNRIPADARIQVVRTVISSSPPSPTGQRIRGEVARLKSPLSGSLPAQSRGESVVIIPPDEVREKFKRVKPLKEIGVKERGWTLDVLNAIRRLGKTEFSTADAYTFTRELEERHPDNRHVRDKIRQQLQVLPSSRSFDATRRDAGLLPHTGRGEWRLP